MRGPAKSAKDLKVYQAAYALAFVNKLTDADGENGESDSWLDFARDCAYLSPDDHGRLSGQAEEVGAMLGAMIKQPSPFVINSP